MQNEIDASGPFLVISKYKLLCNLRLQKEMKFQQNIRC